MEEQQHKLGDIVTITIDQPVGSVAQVYGLVGVIVDIDKEIDGSVDYRVKTFSNCYYYYTDEFRSATDAEIRNTLADILRKS